jgi:hypothetical protein
MSTASSDVAAKSGMSRARAAITAAPKSTAWVMSALM